MIHFYNSEESYVIADFIALGFFWDIFANFMMSRIVVNSIMVSGIIFFYKK